MADPFSIVGLVATTLKGISTAKDFVDGIQRAPLAISNISDELSAIECPLPELEYLVNSANERELNRILREPMNNCERISQQVEKLVRPHVNSSSSKVTVWGRFTFWFKENDVESLQRDMSVCKQSLTLSIATADL